MQTNFVRKKLEKFPTKTYANIFLKGCPVVEWSVLKTRDCQVRSLIRLPIHKKSHLGRQKLFKKF